MVRAYNEPTLVGVVHRLLSIPHPHEVVILDDCSKDRTSAIANELARLFPKIRVVHREANSGKTEALKTCPHH
jgi:glycosyltransferase involved in cell wall biosynthesis